MGRRKITVHRKGYRRKGYTIHRNGKTIRIPPTTIKPTTYKMVDKGKKGKTPKSKRWFKPKVHTGWKKTDPAKTRRRKLLNAVKKDHKLTYTMVRKGKRIKVRQNKYLIAGRMAQQLANVTTDPTTKRLARADARYFFKLAKVKKG